MPLPNTGLFTDTSLYPNDDVFPAPELFPTSYTHIFRPPTMKQQPVDPEGERLWLYYGYDTGISVIKNQDGTYQETQYPSTDDINAAAFVYMGGHEYVVDDDEYESLVAAGYLPYFNDPGADGTYGSGVYGGGDYGG